MGQSSEMVIKEFNRNENREAIKIIENVQATLMENHLFGSAEELEKAIRLMVKFSERFMPDVERWK